MNKPCEKVMSDGPGELSFDVSRRFLTDLEQFSSEKKLFVVPKTHNFQLKMASIRP